MKRQEQKFFLNFNEIKNVLSNFDAYNCYPQRIVTSLYFDTINFDAYHESEDGSVPRYKYRYRWYNDENKIGVNGSLETKITRANFKEKYSTPYKFTSLIELKNQISQKNNIAMQPVCFVSYKRLYYRNNDDIRFTYDYDIKYKGCSHAFFSMIRENIFEIKYDSLDKCNFSSLLGDSMTRYSKYNEAINKIYNLQVRI